MKRQPRRFHLAIIVLATGLLWLAAGWSTNWVVAIPCTVSGVVLVATGTGQWLWPGDRQLLYHMALAGPVSALLALILIYWLGLFFFLSLFLGGVASYFVAGAALRMQHFVPAGVSMPAIHWRLLSKMASDGALLGLFINCARVPTSASIEADKAELERLDEMMAGADWLASPELFHGEVRPFEPVRAESARHRGESYEWLTGPSLYSPHPDMPGADRWQGYTRNRTMAARVLRSEKTAGRPWLVCVHGYRMGTPLWDFQLFDVSRLHQGLGLNLMMPILPLHGVRRQTWLTGGLFLDDPLLNLFHGQAQALLDLRCSIAWIRQLDPEARIGVLGFSLGGYHAALLAAHEPDLQCVIAGIPMTDIPATLWSHIPIAHRHYLEKGGLDAKAISRRLDPVSPLVAKSRVDRNRLFILAATGDQLVAPEQPLALWQHWGQPEMHWYDGSHLSIRHESSVAPFVDRALMATGMLG